MELLLFVLFASSYLASADSKRGSPVQKAIHERVLSAPPEPNHLLQWLGRPLPTEKEIQEHELGIINLLQISQKDHPEVLTALAQRERHLLAELGRHSPLDNSPDSLTREAAYWLEKPIALMNLNDLETDLMAVLLRRMSLQGLADQAGRSLDQILSQREAIIQAARNALAPNIPINPNWPPPPEPLRAWLAVPRAAIFFPDHYALNFAAQRTRYLAMCQQLHDWVAWFYNQPRRTYAFRAVLDRFGLVHEQVLLRTHHCKRLFRGADRQEEARLMGIFHHRLTSQSARRQQIAREQRINRRLPQPGAARRPGRRRQRQPR